MFNLKLEKWEMKILMECMEVMRDMSYENEEDNCEDVNDIYVKIEDILLKEEI